MSLIVDGTTGVTFNDSSLQGAAASPYVLKNRIINGDMRIDQRNAGASVTPASGAYSLDRWKCYLSQSSKYTIQQNAGAVTPPAGFTNYLGVTSSSAYSVLTGDYFFITQFVEGLNFADLGFGTANAQTVTISFWVRSSLTGTFGGSIVNGGSNRSYAFTYTISAANTWEQKTVTIAGDTSGTWLTTNGIGCQLRFSLGAGATYSGTAGAWAGADYASATGATSVVGTNGATLYITGVQLEIGTSATPFERRLYGQELINCQRYYWRISGSSGGFGYTSLGSGVTMSTTSARIYIKHPTSMRASPTVAYGGTLTVDTGTGTSISALGSTYAGIDTLMQDFTTSGQTANRGAIVYTQNASTNYLEAISEL